MNNHPFKRLKDNLGELKLIIPISLIICVFLVSYLWIINYSLMTELNYSLKKNEERALELIAAQIDDTNKVGILISNQLMRVEKIKNYFLKEKREELLATINPIFQEIKAVEGFNHLYFIRRNGTVFLRAHDPKHFNGEIKRESFIKANTTKKSAMVIEGHGLNGVFTERIVTPWIVNNKIIGFIEIGKDLNSIAAAVEETLKIPILFNVMKKYINKEKYIEKQSYKNFDWEAFPDEVQIYSSITNEQLEIIQSNAFKNNGTSFIKNDYQFSKIILKDELGISDIGHIYLIFDLKEKMNKVWNVAGWGVLLGLLLLGSTILYLKIASKVILEKGQQIGILSRFATLGESSANLAHEILNPLSVIKFNAKSVKSSLKDEVALKKIDKIESSIERILKIIDSNRKLARNETEKKSTSINALIQDVAEISKPNLIHHDIELKTMIHDQDVVLSINATQISQILLNLINNAKDAISDLDNPKWIEVKTDIDGDKFIISVLNSGPKIHLEVQKKLFKNYFTTKSSDKGTGLGLTLSAKMAEQNNGKLYFNPDDNFTKFCLELPFA